jgi:hypothetical protein
LKRIFVVMLALILSIGMVIAMASLAMAAPPPPTDLVLNGSFEFPVTGGDSTWVVYPNGTSGLGWNVAAVNPSFMDGLEIQHNTYSSAYQGLQYAELAGSKNDTIWQNIPTVSNGIYILKYVVAPRPGFTGNQIQVSWNGVPIYTTNFTLAPSPIAWLTRGAILAGGPGSTTELRFTQLGPDDGIGAFLDAVSVRHIVVYSLTPETDLNLVGTSHTVSATIRPLEAGVPVNFSVSGANTATGSALTNSSGVAIFTYTGTNPGVDTITATVGDSSLTAEKNWAVSFVTGGGNIKDGKKIVWSATGNVGFLPDLTIVGNFHIKNFVTGEQYKCNNDFSYLSFHGEPAYSPPASFDTVVFTGLFTKEGGGSVTLTIVIGDFGESGAGYDKIAVFKPPYSDPGHIWIGTASGATPPVAGMLINGGNFQVHDGFKTE